MVIRAERSPISGEPFLIRSFGVNLDCVSSKSVEFVVTYTPRNTPITIDIKMKYVPFNH